MKDLLSIVSHFQLQGTVQEINPLGAGLINDTYKVSTLEADAPDYVLQRINHAIFQNVEMLQANINAVTTHIRKKLEEKGEKRFHQPDGSGRSGGRSGSGRRASAEPDPSAVQPTADRRIYPVACDGCQHTAVGG